MVNATDIPEWCVIEAGTSSSVDLQPMLQCSPILHATAGRIKAPTLFIVGEIDRRVPPFQPLTLYYLLKQQGVPTSVKIYPQSGHAITKVELEADMWVNMLLWFAKHA